MTVARGQKRAGLVVAEAGGVWRGVFLRSGVGAGSPQGEHRWYGPTETVDVHVVSLRRKDARLTAGVDQSRECWDP
jgi:hypothetical protein